MRFRRSQDGDGEPRARFALPRVAFRRTASAELQTFNPNLTGDGASGGHPKRSWIDRARELPAGSPYASALVVLAIAVGFVAVLTYYSAQQFTRRAADTRASLEAKSFAEHSSTIATGDAFNGYLQMLRYADDPVLRAKIATPQQRRDVMQQMVYLNTNKLSSLAVVNRGGIILASTDPAIDDVRGSEAFSETRANLGPANSDIILPDGGGPGYVEFTAPLKDNDGTVWAILYGRAEPDRLWTGTLRASVDGGRNVIVNSAGQFSAGVPEDVVGEPWRGVPLGDGRVRATIAGVDSICGLGAIGQGTQIDHGWNVASCLPVSLIQAEASRAMGKQGIVTLAGAVLAAVVGGIALYSIVQRGPTVPAAGPTDIEATDGAPGVDEPLLPNVETPALEPQLPAPVFVADVDALTLIAAYERRNAAVAQQLRESVLARLLIASAQADEAYRLASADPERAATLHAAAIGEIENVRERELRTLGLELHPNIVRLGLPAALRALAKELEPEMTLTLDIGADTDSAGGSDGRPAIDSALRVGLYRLIRETLRLGATAGAEASDLAVRRDGGSLHLRLAITGASGSFEQERLAAARLNIEAYGGSLSVEEREGCVELDCTVPAPPTTDHDSSDPTYEPSADPPPVIRRVLPVPSHDEALAMSLRRLSEGLAGSIELTLHIDPAFDEPGLEDELRTEMFCAVADAAHALVVAGASAAVVALEREGRDIELRVEAAVEQPLDASLLDQRRASFAEIGGRLEIETVDRVTHIVGRGHERAADELPAVVLTPMRLHDGDEPDDAPDGDEQPPEPTVDVGSILALAEEEGANDAA
jgi:hypothetical protein